MSQRIRNCGEEREGEGGEREWRGKRRRKTDDSRQLRRGRTERMEEKEEEEEEERRRPGSGDWKMTIWCTGMAEFLFLEY